MQKSFGMGKYRSSENKERENPRYASSWNPRGEYPPSKRRRTKEIQNVWFVRLKK
jgi:hypothetical protein